MAFFNFSNVWETNKTGDELCETFIKDGRKGKRKKKNKNKHKTKQYNLNSSNEHSSAFLNKSLPNGQSHKRDESSHKIQKKKHLLKGLKNKYGDIHRKIKDGADDKLPLNNSFNYESKKEEKYKNKKGLKRKRSLSETADVTEMTRKYAEPTRNDNSNPAIHKVKKNKVKKEVNGDVSQKQSTMTSKIKNYTNKVKKNLKIIDFEHDTVHIKKSRKKLKKKKQLKTSDESDAIKIDPIRVKRRKEQLQKLQHILSGQEKHHPLITEKKEPVLTLRQKMLQKLKAARFRFLNEQIYTTTSKATEKIFKSDPDAFKAYHEGYRQQVRRWPLNPLDRVIKSINKMPKTHIIADFGCGEARLANSVEQKVYSFDLVAATDAVTACDMAHVPLEDSSIDVAVYCLSLMGTNLKEYLIEANRVLKKGGLLKMAEVESRFEDIKTFTKDCEQFGFKKTWMDLSHNLFYFIDFRKESSIKGKKKLPSITLQPCLYKKR